MVRFLCVKTQAAEAKHATTVAAPATQAAPGTLLNVCRDILMMKRTEYLPLICELASNFASCLYLIYFYIDHIYCVQLGTVRLEQTSERKTEYAEVCGIEKKRIKGTHVRRTGACLEFLVEHCCKGAYCTLSAQQECVLKNNRKFIWCSTPLHFGRIQQTFTRQLPQRN